MSEFLFPLVLPTSEQLTNSDESPAECSGEIGTSIVTYDGFVSGGGSGEITITDGVKFGQIKKIFVKNDSTSGNASFVIPNSNKDLPTFGYRVINLAPFGVAYYEFMWLRRDDSDSAGYWAPIVDGISLSATTA